MPKPDHLTQEDYEWLYPHLDRAEKAEARVRELEEGLDFDRKGGFIRMAIPQFEAIQAQVEELKAKLATWEEGCLCTDTTRTEAWQRLGSAPDPFKPGFYVCNSIDADRWEALRRALFNEPQD